MHCNETAFLCLMLSAAVYFAGSFFQPLFYEQHGTPGYASAQEMAEIQEIKEIPEQALLEGFEIVRQMPELPTGSEITALSMMLNYYGYSIDKMNMALEYLPTVPAKFYEGADGRIYGPDMGMYFVGDPTSEGYICGTGAIVTAADAYLEDVGSSYRAKDLTGTVPEDLYRLVSEGMPVLVWVTIGMQEREEVRGWYTEDGRWMGWSRNDHGAVLIGYDEKTVTIADPLSGLRVYSRDMFEHVYASRGFGCVIISGNRENFRQ